MALIGFILVMGLGLYVLVGGIVLLVGAMCGFSSRGETVMGIILVAVAAAFIWFALANSPLTISWR